MFWVGMKRDSRLDVKNRTESDSKPLLQLRSATRRPASSSKSRSPPAGSPCRRLAFITWPTNQPMVFGFSFTCSTCFGLAAMMSSTIFSMAPVSVTCLRPRFSTMSAGSPVSSPSKIRAKTSLAILPEMVPSLMRSISFAQLRGAHRRVFNVFVRLVERAEKIARHPVGGELAVAPFGDFFKIVCACPCPWREPLRHRRIARTHS